MSSFRQIESVAGEGDGWQHLTWVDEGTLIASIMYWAARPGSSIDRAELYRFYLDE